MRCFAGLAILVAGLAIGAHGSGSGGDEGGGHSGLSLDCLSGIENNTCLKVHHEIGFHASEANGMIVKLNEQNCAGASHLPDQACSVSHECTTCKHYNCLLCSEDEQVPVYVEPLGDKFLFLVVSLMAGAAISTILESLPRETFHPPFTVVMFVLGMVMAMLAETNSLGCTLSDSVNSWKHQDPHSILYALLPPLLFESAFNVNYHVFTKVAKSSIILATSGVLTSTFLTGCVGMLLFGAQFDRIQFENPVCSMFGQGPTEDYAHSPGQIGMAPSMSLATGPRDGNYTCIAPADDDHRRLSAGGGAGGGCYDCSMDAWWASWMFGAVVSATDPVAVVSVLQTLGAQPKLSHMIEGESLLNDGSAVVIFLVFKGLLLHEIQEKGTTTTFLKMIALVARLAGGGVFLGAFFSYLFYAWLRASRNLSGNIEISIMVLSVYMVFYLSEHVFGASGVLATVVYGLSLAKRKHLAMTVETEEQNEIVWQEIGYVANSFTFALAGVILWRIVTKSLNDESSHDDRFKRGEQLGLAVALYFVLSMIRLFTIFLHYHAMRACTKGGYKVQVKEAFFMTYAGLRGAVSLCVALFVDHMDGIPQLVKDVIIFHTCLCVFFTVFVNGITAGWVYKGLGLGIQGGVRGEVDAGSVRRLVLDTEEFLEGMKSHWFHGQHNVRDGGYDLVKEMLNLKLKKDKENPGRDLPPMSDTGDITVDTVDVSKLWDEEAMKKALSAWRVDPLRTTTHHSHKSQQGEAATGDTHDGLTPAMIKEKRLLCYNPPMHEETNEHAAAKGKNAHTTSSLERTGTKDRSESQYKLDLDHHDGHLDIQQDLYSIYLTAIRAHYVEKNEENELTATTCDYLCRAIATGSDFLKSVEMGMIAGEEGQDLRVIQQAHESLKEHIHSFGLSGASIITR